MRIISDLNPNKNSQKIQEMLPKEFANFKYDDILNPPLDSFITNPGAGPESVYVDIEDIMLRAYLHFNGWIERIKW